MILLSISGFLKTILILLTIYFIFKIFIRIVFPLILKSYIEKKQRDLFNQHQPPEKKEGEITIDYVPGKNKKGDNDEGEYVNYEEIK